MIKQFFIKSYVHWLKLSKKLDQSEKKNIILLISFAIKKTFLLTTIILNYKTMFFPVAYQPFQVIYRWPEPDEGDNSLN